VLVLVLVLMLLRDTLEQEPTSVANFQRLAILSVLVAVMSSSLTIGRVMVCARVATVANTIFSQLAQCVVLTLATLSDFVCVAFVVAFPLMGICSTGESQWAASISLFRARMRFLAASSFIVFAARADALVKVAGNAGARRILLYRAFRVSLVFGTSVPTAHRDAFEIGIGIVLANVGHAVLTKTAGRSVVMQTLIARVVASELATRARRPTDSALGVLARARAWVAIGDLDRTHLGALETLGMTLGKRHRVAFFIAGTRRYIGDGVCSAHVAALAVELLIGVALSFPALFLGVLRGAGIFVCRTSIIAFGTAFLEVAIAHLVFLLALECFARVSTFGFATLHETLNVMLVVRCWVGRTLESLCTMIDTNVTLGAIETGLALIVTAVFVCIRCLARILTVSDPFAGIRGGNHSRSHKSGLAHRGSFLEMQSANL